MRGLCTREDEGAGAGTGARRSRPLELFAVAGACALSVIACVLAFGAASALAASGHEFRFSLSEAPVGTHLQEPDALAVDRANGQLFVADQASGTVDVFSSTGSYLTKFGDGTLLAAGVAVDEANGEVYVADSFQDAVLVYKPDGAGGYELLSEWAGEDLPGEEFGEVAAVAVDNSKGASAGDVYILDGENPETEAGAVDVLKPRPTGPEEAEEGEFQRRISSSKLEQPNTLALDPAAGRVLVGDSETGAIYLFSSEGVLEEKLTGKGQPFGSFQGKEEEGENIEAIAVEEATGDIYVAEAQHHVTSQYGPEGQWLGWVTTAAAGAALQQPRGVAFDASGELYVADAGARLVDVFGPAVIVPDVATGKATKPSRTTAILNAVIDGDGKAGKYSFQWGSSEALGQSTAPQSAGPGEEALADTLEGLHAGDTYYFRAVGENENGTNYGIIHKFTTSPAVEDLVTEAVVNLQPESTTLAGTLKPGGVETHYFFQWGPSISYASQTPLVDAGSGVEKLSVQADLEGLVPNSTYHYRLVGENSFGTTYGEDRSFTTSGPPRITDEAPSPVGHNEATLHARVNPDELDTTYRFQYGETSAYGSEIPLGGQSIGSGSTPVAVSAALSALKIGTTYHFRVVAENAAGTTASPDQRFTTVPPALIDSESVAEVSASEATLQGEINPLGHDTHYYFQYGSESCQANPSGCTDLPAPPGTDIGAGETDQPASVPLRELHPGTTYYYRVLASNALGTSEGVQQTFTTKQSATALTLPDNRAWEMVSPPDKQGAPVEALTREGGLILASEDGNSFTYVVNGALGEETQGNRSPEWQQVFARRGPHEWTSQDIETPSSIAKGVTLGQTPEYQYFTPDLSSALVDPAEITVDAEPPLAPGVKQSSIYLRDDETGTYSPLVTEANTAPGTIFGREVHFVTATPDLSHVVISSSVALTGQSSAPGLYEWSGGALQLVSVLPDGAPVKGLVELGYSHTVADALSNDGTRIIWTTDETEPKLGHLYMRDSATGETIKLDAAQGIAEPTGAGTARFQSASSDGSRVFFTDRQRLTADSSAEPLSNEPDLYECEMLEEDGKLACHLSDLSVARGEGEHANVQGLLLATSEDGTSTFLIAQGVLAENENGNGERAEPRKDNLYQAHYDGSEWRTTFIATLSNEDNPEWEGFRVSNTAFLTARVSPDGRYLAFMSAAPITGYDNVDVHSEKPDEEVYVYDSANASLTCVSCDPTGARPAGVLDAEGVGEGLGLLVDRRKVWFGRWLGGNIPGWTAENITGALIQSRYLSDSGRLFFNSPDDLVPAATNEKEDVYEYEPSGVGSCRSSSGACVSLISSGASANESAFVEATPDGGSVFFVTSAQLLPQDTDTAFDIYDARECSEASPCLTPPSPAKSGCAETSTCRPAQASEPAPLGPSLASLSPSGSANLAPHPASAVQGNKVLKTASKPLTRAQKLSNALKACRRLRSKSKRAACENHARKLYAAKADTKRSAVAHRDRGRRR